MNSSEHRSTRQDKTSRDQVLLADLVSYCDVRLNVKAISDYCPNGLQVEAGSKVSRLVAGVTASERLIDRAIEVQADCLLVHHGYFWKNEDPCIVGAKQRRIAKLLRHGISLLAYHLPLDVHPELGNNIQLAKLLGWTAENVAVAGEQQPLLRKATLDRRYTGVELASHIESCLQRKPLHIAVDRPIQRVAWCTGAAQSEIGVAISLGVDAYVSGEISEPTVHEAVENNIHYFAAGHHATERYGVQALAQDIVSRFNIDYEFIDCDIPV